MPHLNETADNAGKNINIQFNYSALLHTSDEDIDLDNNFVEAAEDFVMLASLHSNICDNIQRQRLRQ